MTGHISIVFYKPGGYDAYLFIKEPTKKFNKDDIGVTAENMEKYISFSFKMKVKLVGVTNKDISIKNIQLRFIGSCRFMALSLDKLESNLHDTSGIECDNCIGDMELVNISSKYIALLECKRVQTKKINDLDEMTLKKNFNHTGRYWDFDEKFCFMIRKGVYPYEYMDRWKKFEETKLLLKNAFYSRLHIKCVSDSDYQKALQI